ncbi:MAG: serine/threonine protein kinase, partial [Gammaproteobacteria bacterium]|nr:serine/threonine protein kinase [Gammaproteobacteria bacterium]
FEMLTGERPFYDRRLTNVLNAHIESPVPPLPESAAAFEPLLDRLLAKDRDQRYTNVDQLLVALDEIDP